MYAVFPNYQLNLTFFQKGSREHCHLLNPWTIGMRGGVIQTLYIFQYHMISVNEMGVDHRDLSIIGLLDDKYIYRYVHKYF